MIYPDTVYPIGGQPIQPCIGPFGEPDNTFVCGLNNSDCLDNTYTFQIAGGNNFILRRNQTDAGPALAVEISPTSDPTVVDGANSTTTATSTQTVTVTAAANGSATDKQYSAAAIAGTAVGVGVPLVFALAGAFFVIHSLQKKVRRAEDHQGGSAYPEKTQDHTQDGTHRTAPYYALVSQQPPTPSTPQTLVQGVPATEMSTDREMQELEGQS